MNGSGCFRYGWNALPSVVVITTVELSFDEDEAVDVLLVVLLLLFGFDDDDPVDMDDDSELLLLFGLFFLKTSRGALRNGS